MNIGGRLIWIALFALLLVTPANAQCTPGDYYANQVTSYSGGVPLASGQDATITSIEVTAGTWDIAADVDFTFTGNPTVLKLEGGISEIPDDPVALNSFQMSQANLEPGRTLVSDYTVISPTVRFQTTGWTNFYMIGRCVFSGTGSTCAGYGQIRATCIR
jgi:hypothetical protein